MDEPEAKSDRQRFYDAEIAPALKVLAEKCGERSMSFIATVEFEPESHETTMLVRDDASFQMRMLQMAGTTHGNVDSFFISLARFCKSNGIKTDASMVFGMMKL